jgi:hypothetical protein
LVELEARTTEWGNGNERYKYEYLNVEILQKQKRVFHCRVRTWNHSL